MGGGNNSNDQENKHNQKLQAVLLADSFLTTFRPITLDKQTPKVLLPLNNVTLLDYAIEFLTGAGVQELYVFCVTSGKAVESYLQTRNGWNKSLVVKCIVDSSVTNVGDALRELDKRNVIVSDPFVLMNGDVITNIDIVPMLKAHEARHKAEASAILTVILKRVGGWNIDLNDSELDDGSERMLDKDLKEKASKTCKYTTSNLRALNDDLLVGLNTSHPHGTRVLLYDNNPNTTQTSLPTSFFSHNSQISLRSDLLDCGIYICSPDVLARFSDEFDYLHMTKFISNAVAEEEVGLQSQVYANVLVGSEYAARILDPRTYHAISRDLLRRWCYPMVPDNLPSGYEKEYRYRMHRHGMYVEQKKRILVGRGTDMKGPGMIGSGSSVGPDSFVQGTVIGNHCTISKGVSISNSHIWDNVTIEENGQVHQAILGHGCIIKRGAIIAKGCIVGNGCIIGEGVTLPEFTRISLSKDSDEEDDFSDFENSSSSSDSSADSNEKRDGEEESDFEIVGRDGLGYMWAPNVMDDDDDDSFNSEDSDYSQKKKRATETRIQSQSIGFDATILFRDRMMAQLMDDNCSLGDADGANSSMVNSMIDDDDHENANDEYFYGGDDSVSANTYIIGRQAGVDVVKELRDICFAFFQESTSPVDNLRIELSSFKFSQNANFGDCVSGAILAILELIFKDGKETMTSGQLWQKFKAQLEKWEELLEKLSESITTVDERKSIILAVESAATSKGVIGTVLSREPSFRVLIQTLHDKDYISDEAVSTWAAARRGGNQDSPQGRLFLQKKTQEFVEWVEEESGSESSSDEESDSDNE